MKTCTNFNKYTYKLKHIDDYDEWIIEYDSNDKTFLEFLETNQDRRIIIYLTKDYCIDEYYIFFKELSDKYSNITLLINEKFIDENFISYCLPWFCTKLVRTWDVFYGLIDLGVTDIYICEDLGFALDKVAEVAYHADVAIRAFPNIAQSSWIDAAAIHKFFIRPEDLGSYSRYIDTIEFFGDPKKTDIYYDIYIENGRWYGDLNEIIINLNESINNKGILPAFSDRRVSCEKKCQKGGKCRNCNRILELSKLLNETDIIIEKRKEDSNG